MQVQCDFPIYDQFFTDRRFKLDPDSYARALFNLSTSAVEGMRAPESPTIGTRPPLMLSSARQRSPSL